MAVTRCKNGHYYDDEKFSRCPFCGIDIGLSVSASGSGSSESEGRTIAFSEVQKLPDDDIKTIGIYSDQRGNDFLTGWIVCVKGPEKGSDLRLYHGFNRSGRGYGMQISIEADQTITRKNQCAIVYDGRANSFFLTPEEGNEVLLNGEYLRVPAEIREGDVIGIGQGSYVFIPFCREGRVWDEE